MKSENWELLADVTAERSVLGACLLDRKIPEALNGVLRPRDFYYLHNGEIYAAMEKLEERKTPVDITSLQDELRRDEKLDRLGGPLYLFSLMEGIATAANANYHAKIILDFSLRRQLQSAGRDIISACNDLLKTKEELQDFAENKIGSLKTGRDKLVFLKECLEETCAGLSFFPKYVYTGYPDLDSILGGFEPQDYVLLAARPSMGKTAWALGMAQRMAAAGNTVHFFSLEMSKSALAERLLIAETGIQFGRYRNGALSEYEKTVIGNAAQKLSKLPIFVCDQTVGDIYALKHAVRKSVWQTRKNIVFIDHLQLIQCERRENRNQEMTFISSHLKALAKETDAILIVLSQLSRAVEERTLHRPQLSDLRESGSLEQDADEVIFIYRPEYYKILEQKTKNGAVDLRGLAEIIVAKHRNGRTGECWLVYDKERSRFLDKNKIEF